MNYNEQITEAARFPEENPNPVFRVDGNGCVLYANPASRQLLASWGVTRGECVPDLWQGRFASVLASGEAQKWDAPAGGRLQQLHCVPFPDAGYLNVYGSDVTELRQARDELAKRVEELEVLLNLLPAGVAISYDPEGKDIRVNPALAGMLAMTPEANVSLSADESEREATYRVFDQAGREIAAEDLPIQAAASRGTEVRDMVVDIVREDGVRLALLSYAVPLFDHVGDRRGAVGAYVDISALRAAETERERLLEEVQARNQTLEAQAEEIRTLNADLERRVLERTEQLRGLSRRLVSMQEAERSYVADQLYNQAGQVLAALQLQLARLRPTGGGTVEEGQLALVRSTLNAAIQELHDLARDLRPAGLDRSTLARVLQTHLSAFGKKHGLAVRFDAGGTEELRMPRDVTTAFFRSTQEGLANVARHAGATEVSLLLRREGEGLVVTLADNGAGFEPPAAGRSGGLGLASIQERMTTIGGQLTITSGPTGTVLLMRAPMDMGENRA